MDEVFYSRVIISFLVSGTWIAASTILTERLGSKLGGLFSNLPSNILISLLFIAIVHNVEFVIGVIPGIPIGMAIDTIFLFIFIVMLPKGLFITILVSLLSWLIMAILAVNFQFTNFMLNTIFYVLITTITFFLLEKVIKMPSIKKSRKKYSKWQIIVRIIFAGSTVASVIVISKFFSPYVVGIFSTFPAVLLTTMIILTLNQSKEFARATGKILVLSSSNIIIYGLAVYLSYPVLGLVWGTIISFILAFIWASLFIFFIKKLI